MSRDELPGLNNREPVVRNLLHLFPPKQASPATGSTTADDEVGGTNPAAPNGPIEGIERDRFNADIVRRLAARLHRLNPTLATCNQHRFPGCIERLTLVNSRLPPSRNESYPNLSDPGNPGAPNPVQQSLNSMILTHLTDENSVKLLPGLSTFRYVVGGEYDMSDITANILKEAAVPNAPTIDLNQASDEYAIDRVLRFTAKCGIPTEIVVLDNSFPTKMSDALDRDPTPLANKVTVSTSNLTSLLPLMRDLTDYVDGGTAVESGSRLEIDYRPPGLEAVLKAEDALKSGCTVGKLQSLRYPTRASAESAAVYTRGIDAAMAAMADRQAYVSWKLQGQTVPSIMLNLFPVGGAEEILRQDLTLAWRQAVTDTREWGTEYIANLDESHLDVRILSADEAAAKLRQHGWKLSSGTSSLDNHAALAATGV